MVNVPSDLFGVYATLCRGLTEEEFNIMFSKSIIYIKCMEMHWKAALSVSRKYMH